MSRDPNKLPGDPSLPPGVTARDIEGDYPYDEDEREQERLEAADDKYSYRKNEGLE